MVISSFTFRRAAAFLLLTAALLAGSAFCYRAQTSAAEAATASVVSVPSEAGTEDDKGWQEYYQFKQTQDRNKEIYKFTLLINMGVLLLLLGIDAAWRRTHKEQDAPPYTVTDTGEDAVLEQKKKSKRINIAYYSFVALQFIAITIYFNLDNGSGYAANIRSDKVFFLLNVLALNGTDFFNIASNPESNRRLLLPVILVCAGLSVYIALRLTV